MHGGERGNISQIDVLIGVEIEGFTAGRDARAGDTESATLRLVGVV